MKRISLGTLSLVVLLAGCSPTSQKVASTRPTTAEVLRQDLTGYTFYDAEVVVPPDAKAVVYAPFKLPVRELNVTVGKKVARGQVMMRLAVADAQSSVAAAKATLAAAQSAYATARSENDAPVRDAARALAEARAAERQARSDPSADLTAVTQARVDAEEAHRQAVNELNSATAAERQSVSAAQQYLAEVQRGARMSEIRAPISGTVTALDAVVGNEVGVAPKAPIATIVDYDAIVVRMTVMPEHKDDVKAGDKVLFTSVDKGAVPIEGQVQRIRVVPPRPGEKESVYVAMVSFENSDGKIKPGSVVKRAGVRSGRVEGALVVPLSAVTQNGDGKMVVYVQQGGDWVETPVTLGINDGALVEVKSGLKEKDIVRISVDQAPTPTPAAGG